MSNQIILSNQGKPIIGSLVGSKIVINRSNSEFLFPGLNYPGNMTLNEELSFNNAADLQTQGSTGSEANFDGSLIFPPYSSPKVVRFVYPSGMSPNGVGNNRVDTQAGAKRVYIAINFYLSDPFTLEISAVKFLYFYRTTDVGSAVVQFVPISGVNGTFGIQVDPQVAPGTWIRNSGDIGLVRGNWYYMEVYTIMNSSTSAEDGTLKVWINNSLIINSTNMKYASSGNLDWHRVNLDPYWGGNNVNTVPQDQYLYVDHYIQYSETT